MIGITRAVELQVAKGIIKCDWCGGLAEYGWDAHTIITPNGILELWDDCCTHYYKKDVDTYGIGV